MRRFPAGQVHWANGIGAVPPGAMSEEKDSGDGDLTRTWGRPLTASVHSPFRSFFPANIGGSGAIRRPRLRAVLGRFAKRSQHRNKPYSEVMLTSCLTKAQEDFHLSTSRRPPVNSRFPDECVSFLSPRVSLRSIREQRSSCGSAQFREHSQARSRYTFVYFAPGKVRK